MLWVKLILLSRGYGLAKARVIACDTIVGDDEGLSTGRRALLTCGVRRGVREVRHSFCTNQIGRDTGSVVELLEGSC